MEDRDRRVQWSRFLCADCVFDGGGNLGGVLPNSLRRSRPAARLTVGTRWHRKAGWD